MSMKLMEQQNKDIFLLFENITPTSFLYIYILLMSVGMRNWLSPGSFQTLARLVEVHTHAPTYTHIYPLTIHNSTV